MSEKNERNSTVCTLLSKITAVTITCCYFVGINSGFVMYYYMLQAKHQRSLFYNEMVNFWLKVWLKNSTSLYLNYSVNITLLRHTGRPTSRLQSR